MAENWFHDLFINEAKPALERHSGGGESTEFLTFPIIYTEHNGRPTGLNMSYNEFRHALEIGLSAVKSISPDEYEQYREIRTMTFCRIDNDGSISIWFNEESSPVEIDSAGNFMDAPM